MNTLNLNTSPVVSSANTSSANENEIGEDALFSWLDLFQLADSALPVGNQSHSFGLETLIAEGALTVANLPAFLPDYLQEVGVMEAVFWRGAYALGAQWNEATSAQWRTLNQRLSALRPARESRAASVALGRRLLALAADMTQHPTLIDALHSTRKSACALGVECHYVTAFGFASGALALAQDAALSAYLHQSVVGLLASCQKLLPIGQSELVRLRWRMKQSLTTIVNDSRSMDWRVTPPCSTPGLDVASMRHPGLAVRLFIS